MFDPKAYSLGAQLSPPKQKISSKRQTAPFIKGPIPLAWIQAAARLPGKALHIAMVLTYLCGLEGISRVKLSQKIQKDFGIQRHSGYRALEALETAGLVSIQRGPGRLPVVDVHFDSGNALKKSPEGVRGETA